MWKGFFLLLPLFFLPWVLPAAPQDQLLSQATSISSQLRETLTGSQKYLQELETRSILLQRRLDESEILLEAQGEELRMLSDSLTHTMNSFSALSLELQNSVMRLHTERVLRQARDRTIAVFAAAFLAMVVGKITVAMLSKRGVPVPKWLKIIV